MAAAFPANAVLTRDVDPATHLCANGLVRVTESPGKGLGAFAARAILAHHELGQYQGEVLTLAEFHVRYGVQGQIDAADWERHCTFSRERQSRGVGVTGQYVFAVASLYVDAEDPEHSNWTRFLNHSDTAANLQASKRVTSDGVPEVRFITKRTLDAGEELLFDYGPGYAEWLQRHCEPRGAGGLERVGLAVPLSGSHAYM